MATSFNQFIYCDLCKISHTVAIKKHIYCKRHQEILRNILIKFKRKIQESSIYLTKPEVHDESWETGAKFWCYFCANEVNKHFVLDTVTFACGGLLEHIASKEHETAMHNFWWKHRIDKGSMKHYLISKDKLERFHDLIPQIKEDFIKKMGQLHKEEIDKLREIEQQRKSFHQSVQIESAEKRSQISNADSYASPGPSSLNTKLTSHQCNGKVKVPPWLLDEDGSEMPAESSKPSVGFTSDATIGPTLADYERHVERERRKRLNPDRVGANFDHSSPTPEGWLPSFGRVWNFGRRWQSRQQYRKELSRKKQKKRKVPTNTKSEASPANGETNEAEVDLEQA